jgi:hypothetical protein
MMRLPPVSRFRFPVSCLLVFVCACSPASSPPALPPAEIDITGPAGEIGFGLPVRLRARVRPAVGHWRLTWQQVWGPPAAELHADRGGELLELRTSQPPSPKLAGAYRGQVQPLSAEAAGRMVFQVTAEREEDGARLTRTAEVIPAFPHPGWPRLALGTDLYVSVDPATRDRWRADGNALRLDSPRVGPHLLRVRAFAATWMHLRSPEGGELRLRGGVWLGDEGCGRYDCHPRERGGWGRTQHATVLDRALAGELGRSAGAYQDSCLPCHTVGYQPGEAARNDGFDDRARTLGWHVPAHASPRAARELPVSLRQRANVQCESCHGPGWFFVGYGEEICAQCHDLAPRYLTVSQLRKNRMARTEQTVAAAPKDGVCRDCHQADEWLRSLRGHRSSSRHEVELEAAPRGVTCPVCHDPHQRDCRRQLRLCGDVEIPGGLVQAGQGALCIACHTGEANIRSGPLLRPFKPAEARVPGAGHGLPASAREREPDAAPHAPQFQLLSGRGGQFLRLPTTRGEAVVYPHLGVPESCVGCHYREEQRRDPQRGHTFKLLDDSSATPAAKIFCARQLDLGPVQRSRATASCAPCHGPLDRLDAPARGDYDGNGRVEGFVTELRGLLALLQRELEQQLRGRALRDASGRLAQTVAIVDERVVLTDIACQPLGAARGQGLRSLLPDAPLLHKAAFNLLLLLRDGSGGLHNPQYSVRLLQTTLEELERARGSEPRHRWKRP